MKRTHPSDDGNSTGVEVIDLTANDGYEAYRVYFESDRDLAGVYRLAVVVTGLLAVPAGFQAWSDRSLPLHARFSTCAVAGAYVLGTVYARFSDRSKPPLWVRKHPLRTLAVCYLPFGATLATGGGRSPLYALAAATAGTASVVYGRRTGMVASVATGALWALQAKIYTAAGGTQPSSTRRYIRVPLAFVAAAQIAGELSTVAFNARSLDNLLLDLRRERELFDDWGDALGNALADAATTLIGVVERNESPSVRRNALRALGRLFEEAGALRIAEDLRTARTREPWWVRVRRGLSDSGIGDRIDQRKPWGRELYTLADERKRDWVRLFGDIEVVNEVDRGMRIDDPELLAVAGATITAGIANALRHSPDLRNISIQGSPTEDGRSVELTILNDGASPPTAGHRRGSGLATLRDEVAGLRGELEWKLDDDGRHRLWMQLPLQQTPESNPELFPWGSVIDRFEAAVSATEWVCLLMVAFELGPTLERDERRSWLAAAAAALGPAVRVYYRKREAPTYVLLGVSVVATAIATGRQRGLLTGWVNINLVHHALHHRRRSSLFLAAANATALTFSYHREMRQCLPRWWQRDSGLGPLGHQFAVTISGILGMILGVVPAVEGMRQDAHDVPAEIGAVEALHDIAADFHDHHPCTEPMETVRDRSTDLRTKREVDRALAAIRAVESIRPPKRGALKLVGDMATVIGRRVSPSDVAPKVEYANLSWVPTRRFRRYAVAVADLVGREAAGGSPPGWPVRRRRLDVRVSAVHNSGTLRLTVHPVGSPTEKKRAELEVRLLELSARLDDWTTAGSLTVSLYPQTEAGSRAEPAASTTLKTA